jgi:hypothetical protein
MAGTTEVAAMNAAMEALKTSSSGIAKIIKPIDEIARVVVGQRTDATPACAESASPKLAPPRPARTTTLVSSTDEHGSAKLTRRPA